MPVPPIPGTTTRGVYHKMSTLPTRSTDSRNEIARPGTMYQEPVERFGWQRSPAVGDRLPVLSRHARRHVLYGTIAKLRIRAGMEKELDRIGRRHVDEIDGLVFEHVFRMDDDPQELMLVVGFEDRESYRANAESPEQHEAYEAYRALLEADPEWHDGEIIFSQIAEGSASV